MLVATDSLTYALLSYQELLIAHLCGAWLCDWSGCPANLVPRAKPGPASKRQPCQTMLKYADKHFQSVCLSCLIRPIRK